MNVKKILEEKFNIPINTIKQIGEGYDSKAYLVNDEYIFKIKFSVMLTFYFNPIKKHTFISD